VKFVARFAQKIGVTTENSAKYFPARKVFVTGYPTRLELASADRAQASRHFDLEPDRKTLLVFGGSRGAHSINYAVTAVVEQLVGADFFNAMAAAYVAETKPQSAVLIHYGASFADFIQDHEAAQSLPYLADVARFENAWWQAYHAAEAQSFDPQNLARVAPDEWGAIKFLFHPSVQLFTSEMAAVSIWQWHQMKGNTAPLTAEGMEFAILSRPGREVEVRLISPEGWTFLHELKSGQLLEDAVLATQAQFPAFDLQAHLAALFQLQLITGISK